MQQLLPTTLKKTFNQSLHRLGYYRRFELPPVDLRGLVEGPEEAYRRCGGLPFVLDVPLSNCRGMLPAAFPCIKGSGHPYIETAIQLLNGRISCYQGSPLFFYYQSFQPRDLSEVYGLELREGHPAKALPPFSFVFPWVGSPSRYSARRRSASLAAENKTHGQAVSGDAGWHSIGPVSLEKGELEFARLGHILGEIEAHGYIRSDALDGDVYGVVLIHDDDFVVTIAPGQHRIAAMAALGYKKIPVRIGAKPVSIVRRETVGSWPAVRDGVISEIEALSIFDRVFEGQQPFEKESFRNA
ncbi:hypothetical protein [Alkalispirochaeta alkalica]|uniref:hypothetical protein n=1 Tax=Alkalispirochaeta alkalica TaxID=46356 RepID=UPI0012FD79EF|nr:hypothetical protein [Alkalispirochaeta alkalica]